MMKQFNFFLVFAVAAFFLNGCLFSQDADGLSENSETSSSSGIENAGASSSSQAVSSNVDEVEGSENSSSEGIEGGDSSSSEGTAGELHSGSDLTVVSWTEEFDETYTLNGSKIIWEETIVDCEDGGILSTDVVSREEYYLVSGDTLYLWDENDCLAEAFKGGGTFLEGGIWTHVGTVAVPDPDHVEDSWCEGELPESDIPEGIIATTEFSQGSRWDSFAGEFCFSDELDFMPSDIVDCNTLKLLLSGGETVIMDIESLSNEGVTLSYTYGGNTCTMETFTYSEPTEASCQAAWEAYQTSGDAYYFSHDNYDPARVVAEEAFEKCVEENGFPDMGEMM